MLINNVHTATLYGEAKANEIADANNAADEDGWNYVVGARGNFFVIAVYDEIDALVDYL